MGYVVVVLPVKQKKLGTVVIFLQCIPGHFALFRNRPHVIHQGQSDHMWHQLFSLALLSSFSFSLTKVDGFLLPPLVWDVQPTWNVSVLP